MRPLRVKICGIRSLEEAELAVSLGADALGFLCGLSYRTDDELELQAAQRIIAKVPPFISTVLVTHQTGLDWVVRSCQESRCSTVQLHGDFAVEQIPELRTKIPNVKIIKAVSVVDDAAIQFATAAAKQADAIILDTRTATRIGGTGRTHDWSISARVVEVAEKPVILAGGLNPDNVAKAIETVRPFAVDVNSGVEFPDGSKSPQKIGDFVRLAKAAGAGTSAGSELTAAQYEAQRAPMG